MVRLKVIACCSIAHGEVSNCVIDGTLVTITYTGNFPRLCNISALLSSTPIGGTPLQQFHLELDNGACFVIGNRNRAAYIAYAGAHANVLVAQIERVE